MTQPQSINVTAAHITRTPGVCGGKPCIAGRRIRVQDVYEWHEVEGLSAAEIAVAYQLTPAQVYAALTYAFDHLDDIKADIAAAASTVEAFKQEHPDRVIDTRHVDYVDEQT